MSLKNKFYSNFSFWFTQKFTMLLLKLDFYFVLCESELVYRPHKTPRDHNFYFSNEGFCLNGMLQWVVWRH
jgi:hypothetical protein